MRQSFVACFLVLFVLVTFGCGTTYRKSRPDLPAHEREAVELGTLYDEFETAVEERRFERAEDMLAELEQGVDEASRAFVMHKRYPILSAQIVRAPKKLQAAKKSANIEALVEQTQGMLEALAELRESFEGAGGSEEELDRFDELTSRLEDHVEEHEEQARDPRYRDIHERAGRALEDALPMRRIYVWQLEVTESLNEILDPAPVLPESPEDFAAAGDAATRRADALEQCAVEGETLAYADGASVDVAVSTLLTVAPLDDVRALCAVEAESTRALADRYHWRARAQAGYDVISEALRRIEASESKRDALAAHEAAVDAMASCPELLDPNLPGYDPEISFDGHMGTKSAEPLTEACITVIGNLEARLPLLRWQAELERHGEAYAAAVDTMKSVEALADRDARIERLSATLDALETCQQRAGALAIGEEDAWAGAGLRQSNRRAAAKLEKRCRMLRPKVEAALDATRSSEE